jgi:Zn-dependent membrane protease YugP
MGFFFFDPLYFIMLLPALLLGLYAQFKVQGAYNKYLKVANASRLSGLDAARQLLGSAGLSHITIEGVPGQLSDNYDPQSKTLRLSEGVARSASVASMAIVAHEVGHAIQDDKGYAPLRFRGFIVPGVKVGATLGPILFFVGLLLQAQPLAIVGLILYSSMAFFALATLPTELNASSRAMGLLTSSGLIVGREEEKGARAVLNAAALTYVAFVAQVLLQLLYYVLLLSGGRRRD